MDIGKIVAIALGFLVGLWLLSFIFRALLGIVFFIAPFVLVGAVVYYLLKLIGVIKT